MGHWLRLSSYHWFVLLIAMAASAAVLAWLSFGLINLAMANVNFLTRHGLLAIREGGLWQLTAIGAKAGVALAAYLLFKAIETELIYRWRSVGK